MDIKKPVEEEFIRSVNDFEKLARVGEGTYGVVCMYYISIYLSNLTIDVIQIRHVIKYRMKLWLWRKWEWKESVKGSHWYTSIILLSYYLLITLLLWQTSLRGNDHFLNVLGHFLYYILEIKILKEMSHPQVVSLLEVVVGSKVDRYHSQYHLFQI